MRKTAFEVGKEEKQEKVRKMTNTYSDDAPQSKKLYEELRCMRCVLERILRVMDEGLFVDYQMEKFGKDYEQQKEAKK
ncbi:MAG: hypothetical protein Q7T16_02360 [Candidatus Burarchaeum sp.]|nr:hypothetical protein [Candidatus Burarchaeum sp.]MDO8339477.1 hypothetical protein [Candidatus Burarchaeum sp.]